MQIFWHGFSCIRIEASHGDKDAVLVTDPYSNESGLRFPRTLAPDIVALTHQDAKRFPSDVFTNEPFIINNPGEYEVNGFFVYAMPVRTGDDTHPYELMYRFEVEGMSVGFLGGMKRPLTDEEAGQLGNIDILLIPVGGGDKLTAKQAAETISKIEPRMVVPLYYHTEGVKEKLGTADAFCKELVCKRQDSNKLKIAKKDLPAEDLVVAVLERA
ncbi:MBL fold metallo-hydrolase [Candidatus Uhrbacteria bacterium]|nr:MBL fold metallo-hydrolase [Candidatus Uhrbacteria bacterium]